MRRYDDQKICIDSSGGEDDFTKRVRKYERKLAKQRAAAKRVARAKAARVERLRAAAAAATSSGSSSSSSSEDTSSSSSEVSLPAGPVVS